MTDPRLITTREAADMLDVSTETILRYIWSGRLPGSRLRHGAKRLGYLIPYAAVVGVRDGNKATPVQKQVPG